MTKKKHLLPNKKWDELDDIDKFIIAKKVGIVPNEVPYHKFKDFVGNNSYVEHNTLQKS